MGKAEYGARSQQHEFGFQDEQLLKMVFRQAGKAGGPFSQGMLGRNHNAAFNTLTVEQHKSRAMPGKCVGDIRNVIDEFQGWLQSSRIMPFA